MPRLHTVKSARKEHKCGRCGKVIQKQESYFWWANKTGPRSSVKRVRCADHRPRPSEVTSNQYQAMILAAQEDWEDWKGANPEDTESMAQEIVTVATEIADTMEENSDNIENGFGHETIQSAELRERGEAWRGYADELEQAIDDARTNADDECGICGATEEDHEETDVCAECGLAEADHYDETDEDHTFDPEEADHEYEPDISGVLDLIDEAIYNTPE